MCRYFLIGLLCLADSTSVLAQIRREPGLVIDGKVVVRVRVSLRDANTPYDADPIGGMQLRFFRSEVDSIVATTDEAGTLTTLLAPGKYRVVSAGDVVWKGNRYSWSVPISVVEGMSVVELREGNATVVSSSRASAQERSPSVAPVSGRTAVYRTPKDPTTAMLFSLLLAGGGHFYAGEGETGVGLLLIDLAGWVLYVKGVQRSDCSAYGGSCFNTQQMLGFGLVIGSTLYGVIDGAAAARRHNERHGISIGSNRVIPLIAPGAGPTMRVGFSLR
jgi:hypothetical protein